MEERKMCKAKDCVYYRMCAVKDQLSQHSCMDYEPKESQRRMSPYERTKAAVYATGNKWAIENFHATHD